MSVRYKPKFISRAYEVSIKSERSKFNEKYITKEPKSSPFSSSKRFKTNNGKDSTLKIDNL